MRSLLILAMLLLPTPGGAGDTTAALGRQQPASPAAPPDRPITMAQLQTANTSGVSVAEVSDYVYGGYSGPLQSPPHADLNLRKAYVIFWKDFNYRFVFSHEASYCPWFEMPSGAGVS